MASGATGWRASRPWRSSSARLSSRTLRTRSATAAPYGRARRRRRPRPPRPEEGVGAGAAGVVGRLGPRGEEAQAADAVATVGAVALEASGAGAQQVDVPGGREERVRDRTALVDRVGRPDLAVALRDEQGAEQDAGGVER